MALACREFKLNPAAQLRISDPLAVIDANNAALLAVAQHDPPIKQRDFLRAITETIDRGFHVQTRLLILAQNGRDIGKWEAPEYDD